MCEPPSIHLDAADPQTDSALFRLPLELRQSIYGSVWQNGGLIQHVLQDKGRCYTHAVCVTDHEAPDDRQIRPTNPQDGDWARRLASSWGNHWRCEEEASAPCPGPFLPMLRSCKLLYIECQPAIYEALAFVFTDVDTAHHFFLVRQPRIIHSMRSLHLSFQLENINDIGYMNQPDGNVRRWQEVCQALAGLRSLCKVGIWLDTNCPKGIVQLLEEPELFRFPDHLASILTLDCPASEESELAELASFTPRFHLKLRGYPSFGVDSHSHVSERSEEPTEPWTGQISFLCATGMGGLIELSDSD